jgi:hypothetical protein
MSFKEGYEFGHLRDRRSPFERCVDMVLDAKLDELEIYGGADGAKRGVAEEIAAGLYKEGTEWQAQFAGRLAAYALGTEYIEPTVEPGLPLDPRQLIRPSAISA